MSGFSLIANQNHRKGKVQLIDASGDDFWKPMRNRVLGSKRREMDESHIAKVLDIYNAFEDSTDKLL
jgi:type I restriction enzyme M protein